MLARIAPPSLLRVLVFRTATVSLLAALVIVFVAQYVSNNLVQARFQDEAAVIANTATAGIQEFSKQFYPQVEKDGIIVDERFNGGGLILGGLWMRRN